MSNDEQNSQPNEHNSDHENEFEEDSELRDEHDQGEDEPNKGSGASGVIFPLLVLGIVLIGGYYWYANFYTPDRESLVQQIAAVNENTQALQTVVAAAAQVDSEAAVADIAAQVTDLNSELSGKVKTLTRSIESVEKAQQQLQQSVKSLYEKEDNSSLTWVLAEAEYLVLAASQRLALEGDINTAIAALKAADQRLGSAEHPDLIPIRDQIIEDATALEAVRLPDIEGLAIYLAKVIGQVKELPTKQIASSVEPFSATKNLANDQKNWRNVADSVWRDLVELVEVKDAALPDSVLFDPELKYFLQQNLRLELASARLAALRRDGENFRASVSLVKGMLSEFYDTSATKVASIVQRLDEASGYEFEPALPKITQSLDVIRKHIAADAKAGAAQ